MSLNRPASPVHRCNTHNPGKRHFVRVDLPIIDVGESGHGPATATPGVNARNSLARPSITTTATVRRTTWNAGNNGYRLRRNKPPIRFRRSRGPSLETEPWPPSKQTMQRPEYKNFPTTCWLSPKTPFPIPAPKSVPDAIPAIPDTPQRGRSRRCR